MKQPNYILVGSRAFFGTLPEFKSKDADYLRLVEKPTAFQNVRQTSTGGMCLFEWRAMSADQFVELALQRGPAMQVGKFLVPAFAEKVGITIEHLQRLAPLFEQLDPAHQYERTIRDAYVENGNFTLTEEQRAAAFEQYKQARNKTE